MFVKRCGCLIVEDYEPWIKDAFKIEQEDFLTEQRSIIPLYLEVSKNKIFVPRYGLKNVSVIKDLNGVSCNFDCHCTPRDTVQSEAVDFIVSKKSCLINLPPGRGKTNIAIMAMSKIKKRFAILVDQLNLAEQWKQRLLEFTSLRENQIGIFSGDNKRTDYTVLICLVQSLKNLILSERSEQHINRVRSMFRDFGAVIVDEVHSIVGTEKLSMSLYCFSCSRYIGLTATLFRGDGRNRSFYEWFGSEVYSGKQYDILPKIYILPFDSRLTTKELSHITMNYYKNLSGSIGIKNYFNKLRWVNYLIKKNVPIDFMSSVIRKLAERRKRLLVVSHYIDLLQAIASRISDLDVSLYTRGEGSGKIEKILVPQDDINRKITLTTYKMCGKGIDNKEWDTLVLLTPESAKGPTLKQVIGRVCRACEDKEDAWVVDLYDVSMPRCVTMKESRLMWYLKEGFHIAYHK